VLQVSAEESPKYKGDTGFMNQEQADQLRDLFLSGERYEVVNGRLIPIVVNAKNTKFFANRDNLISLQLEWQRAYINESYTPAALMPTTRSCPAMEFFQVKEVNKTTVQIMWSLMMPYDRVHVQLVYDSTTYNFYYDGNKGSVRQAITLPTGDMSITAKARTVCDEVAGTYGAYKTISVSYISNNLPVAVDDTFSINQGFGTSVTLNHSVLDNDYDPDGDAIAVIADSGSTHESGTYAIDAAGIITYTPPSTAFVGQDYFDYQVRETPSGTPVTARAYINVGAAVKVYAKMVMRNVSGTSYQTGEVWVDFFSDAAATTPLDVTSLSITVSLDDTVHSVDSSIPLDTTTTNTITKAATGNKVRMYSGNLYIDNPPYYETHSFVLNAGTGYTVI
jgi:hypothetical protein